MDKFKQLLLDVIQEDWGGESTAKVEEINNIIHLDFGKGVHINFTYVNEGRVDTSSRTIQTSRIIQQYINTKTYGNTLI